MHWQTWDSSLSTAAHYPMVNYDVQASLVFIFQLNHNHECLNRVMSCSAKNTLLNCTQASSLEHFYLLTSIFRCLSNENLLPRVNRETFQAGRGSEGFATSINVRDLEQRPGKPLLSICRAQHNWLPTLSVEAENMPIVKVRLNRQMKRVVKMWLCGKSKPAPAVLCFIKGLSFTV